MSGRMKQRALKPWHGLVFFCIVMALFFILGAPMQSAWGIYGVAATEILLLVLALLFMKLMGYSFMDLFPIRKPKLFSLIGTLVIWFSTYLLVLVISLIQFRLFPLQANAVNSGLNNVIYSVPFFVSVVIVAVFPAICEEAVHRGVILHTLYTIRKEWVVVLLMGIYFGIFHTDLIRFLPTAILGAAISYIMLETENILYSAFFHFINNFLPFFLQMLLMLLGTSTDDLGINTGTLEVPIISIGLYMMFAAICPLLLYLGNYLLHYEKGKPVFPKGKRKKVLLWILIPSVLLAVGGWLVMLLGFMFDPALQDLFNTALGILH